MAKKEKLFVVRKYIMATDVNDAIKKDKKTAPDDVYLDPEWKEKNLVTVIGFSTKTK